VCIDPKNAYIFSGYAALIPLKVPNAEEWSPDNTIGKYLPSRFFLYYSTLSALLYNVLNPFADELRFYRK
jgi:hypothetical protein